jgi:hypothetical protein
MMLNFAGFKADHGKPVVTRAAAAVEYQSRRRPGASFQWSELASIVLGVALDEVGVNEIVLLKRHATRIRDLLMSQYGLGWCSDRKDRGSWRATRPGKDTEENAAPRTRRRLEVATSRHRDNLAVAGKLFTDEGRKVEALQSLFERASAKVDEIRSRRAAG